MTDSSAVPLSRRYGLSRRSTLIGAALLLLAVTGCDPALGATPTNTSTPTPPAGTPLAVWSQDGDFDSAGLRALRPPTLVIYGDGTVIADATYQTQLDPSTLASLMSHLVSALSTPDVAEPKTPEPTGPDTPVTTFSVWTGTTTLRVQAGGVDELRDAKVYPDALYDARDRLSTVYQKVTTTAMPYLSNQVRVVTHNTDHSAATVTPWPADLPLPSAPSTTLAALGVTDPTVCEADLSGATAETAVRVLTRDLDDRGAWPTYRTSTGDLIQASWRYLLPSEAPPTPSPQTSQ